MAYAPYALGFSTCIARNHKNGQPPPLSIPLHEYNIQRESLDSAIKIMTRSPPIILLDPKDIFCGETIEKILFIRFTCALTLPHTPKPKHEKDFPPITPEKVRLPLSFPAAPTATISGIK